MNDIISVAFKLAFVGLILTILFATAELTFGAIFP
jgi:hypothetical protein